MKKYTKQIDGKAVVKTRKEIVIRKDGRVTYNPTEDMILADGWIEYIQPTVTAPELTDEQRAKAALVRARHKKRNEILEYDKSTNVNVFFINDVSLWLDREERIILQRRFEIEQKNGIVNSTLWKNGIEFPLVISDAILMLDAIEMYAIRSFDCTQKHYAAINNMNTIEDIENYDHTSGYPEKLRF